MQDIYKGMKVEITLHLESHKDTTPMQERKLPFTIEVLNLTRDREIVGGCFPVSHATPAKQRNKERRITQLPWSSKNAFEELCEEAKLHASSQTTPTTQNSTHPKDAP